MGVPGKGGWLLHIRVVCVSEFCLNREILKRPPRLALPVEVEVRPDCGKGGEPRGSSSDTNCKEALDGLRLVTDKVAALLGECDGAEVVESRRRAALNTEDEDCNGDRSA